MVTEAERLFADYNFYWLMTGRIQEYRASGRYIRPYKFTQARAELFSDLAAWCRDRGIDPRLWIYTLFRARCWRFAPQLARGHLLSEAMVERYRRLRGLDGYRRRVLETLPSEAYDPNRDLNSTVESRKAYYASSGQTERCMREMVETLGYHPRSAICAGCPSRASCRSKLEGFVDFDIIALREGRLTAEQAMMQVRRASCA